MGNQLVHIYNFDADEWRPGPATTLVGLALTQSIKSIKPASAWCGSLSLITCIIVDAGFEPFIARYK